MPDQSKEVRQLIKLAEGLGWRVVRSRVGWWLYAPDGVHTHTIHKTCSDHRWLKNSRAQIRRYGRETQDA